MMKVKITKASDFKFEEMRKISTLQDLKGIEEEFSSELIVRFADIEEQQEEGFDISIIIYDDYVE